MSNTRAVIPGDLPRTSTQAFLHFRSLPRELRFKIYTFAVLPRLVSIFAYAVPFTFEKDGISRLLEYDPDLFSDESSMIRKATERFFTNALLITPLLHVDSESRSFLLSQNFRSIECVRHYQDYDSKKMFLHRYGRDGDHRGNPSPTFDFRGFMRAVPIQNQQYSLVDPKSDVFFLEDPRLQQSEFVISSIDVVVRWIGPYFLKNLKRLAVPYYTWRKATIHLNLNTITEFNALEELYISLLGCEELSPGSDWPSIVNGFNPHFEEMETHVLGDLDDLVKRYPDWKRPAIKFVKDKSALLKELGL